MFRLPEDNTYNDIREKSLMSWLKQVRAEGSYIDSCGAKLAMEYMQYLEDRIQKLERKNALMESHMRKLKQKLNTEK